MNQFPTPEHERLAREGMYHPESEGDACGVGLVAATDGQPSRRVVVAGIEALKALWPCGAGACVGQNGDRGVPHPERGRSQEGWGVPAPVRRGREARQRDDRRAPHRFRTQKGR